MSPFLRERCGGYLGQTPGRAIVDKCPERRGTVPLMRVQDDQSGSEGGWTSSDEQVRIQMLLLMHAYSHNAERWTSQPTWDFQPMSNDAMTARQVAAVSLNAGK